MKVQEKITKGQDIAAEGILCNYFSLLNIKGLYIAFIT